MTKKMYAITVLLALFVTLTANGAAEAKKFPMFSTEDIDGNAVTSDIFSENEVTMINFWATWCPPCVAEMPDLAELADALDETDGEDGLIGILVDANDNGAIPQAEEILDNAEAYFTQLRPSEEMRSILDTIDAIPTSIFVDSNGNIVGPIIVGSRSKREYMNAMLLALVEARK